jgi:hypothetical protein
MPRRHVWFDHGGGLLAREFASLWRCLMLGSGMPSTGLRLLPSVACMASLDREVSFQPWRRCPWWSCELQSALSFIMVQAPP